MRRLYLDSIACVSVIPLPETYYTSIERGNLNALLIRELLFHDPRSIAVIGIPFGRPFLVNHVSEIARRFCFLPSAKIVPSDSRVITKAAWQWLPVAKIPDPQAR